MIRPTNERVVLLPFEAESTTAGGIILPEAAKEKPLMGKILAVSAERDLPSGGRFVPQVKVGDVVIYSKYAGDEFTVAGTKVFVLEEKHVLGIVE